MESIFYGIEDSSISNRAVLLYNFRVLASNTWWKAINTLPWREADSIAVRPDQKHAPSFPKEFPVLVNGYWFSNRFDLPMNYHDYLEVSLVTQGQGTMFVGRRRIPLQQGDLILMGPDVLHTFEAERRDDMSIMSLHFQPELVFSAGEPASSIEWLRPFFDHDTLLHPVIDHARTAVVANLFGELVETLSRESRYRIMQARICLLKILLEVFKEIDRCAATDSEPRKHDPTGRLTRVLNWMNESYERKLTLDEAASIACLSTKHFCRFFKHHTGSTFTNRLSHIRVVQAQRLLLQTSLRTNDIAYEVGFGCESYFFREFRRITGRTPGEFRSAEMPPTQRRR